MRSRPLLCALALTLARCGGGGGESGSPQSVPPGPFLLLVPSDGAMGTGLAPSFFWTDAAGGTGYRFRIDDGPAFDSPVFESLLPSGTVSLVLPSPLLSAGSVYYWQVAATNPAGETVASNAPFSFSTATLFRWAKSYGSGATDVASFVIETADGGFLAAGATSSFGSGGNDGWLVKLGADGVVQWEQAYGGTANDYLTAVRRSGTGYVATGSTSSFGAGFDDGLVLRLDAAGAILWQKTYGGAGTEILDSVRPTPEGGFIVAGTTGSYGAGTRDVWILKLDAGGGVVWERAYGLDGMDQAYAIEPTADGGYLVAAEGSPLAGSSTGFWILKLDSDGALQWQKRYKSGGGGEVPYDLLPLSDGGCVVAGYSNYMGGGVPVAWALRLDSGGGVVWQKAFGGSGSVLSRFNGVRQASDGGLILAGYVASFSFSMAYWMVKIGLDGSDQWQRRYGGGSAILGLELAGDGSFVVAGQTNAYGAGGTDAWIIRMSDDGSDPLAGTATAYAGWDTSALITIVNTSATVTATSCTATDPNLQTTPTAATVMQQAP